LTQLCNFIVEVELTKIIQFCANDRHDTFFPLFKKFVNMACLPQVALFKENYKR
jgi:hypothetical protein